MIQGYINVKKVNFRGGFVEIAITQINRVQSLLPGLQVASWGSI